MRLSLPARALVLAALSLLAGCKSRQPSVGSPTSSTSVGSSGAPDFTSMSFERTPCFGTCPVYRVRVSGSGSGSGSGSVSFEGIRNVDSVGTFVGQLSSAEMASLRRAFADAQYFTLDDKYGYGEANCREYGTDASRVITSVTTVERTKTIDHDLGCANVPARLADLYRRFDEIVGTSRWIGRR